MTDPYGAHFRALAVMSHATGLDEDERSMPVPALMECPICHRTMGAHSPDQADGCLVKLAEVRRRLAGSEPP